jgi:hypothetical protein
VLWKGKVSEKCLPKEKLQNTTQPPKGSREVVVAGRTVTHRAMSGKEEEEQSVPAGPRARKLQTVLETALQTYVGSITQQQFMEAFPHRNAQVDAILKEAFDTLKDDIIKNTRVPTQVTYCFSSSPTIHKHVYPYHRARTFSSNAIIWTAYRLIGSKSVRIRDTR